MRRIPFVFALLLVAGAAVAQISAPRLGPLNIELPADWSQRFIRFATVDKDDRRIIRHLYVNPEAYFAARPGEALPFGTVIVMADHRARTGPDGALLRDHRNRLIPEAAPFVVAVQEKRQGWGEGYSPELRNGNWEYARFNPDLTRPAGADTPQSMRACFACHIQARAAQDFAFDFWDHVQARR